MVVADAGEAAVHTKAEAKAAIAAGVREMGRDLDELRLNFIWNQSKLIGGENSNGLPKLLGLRLSRFQGLCRRRFAA